MKFIRIGNRCFDLQAVTHVFYDEQVTSPDGTHTWRECVVSFGADDYQVFYNAEADRAWECFRLYAHDLTPTSHPELEMAL